MIFCVKCVRQLCTTCLVDQSCQVGAASEGHTFIELKNVPAWLRNQLDSIQGMLGGEQSALLDAATKSASELERKDEDLHAAVERTVQRMQDALQMLVQLQRTISAAAASEIARVLRAGVESNASKQRAEDVQARVLACRQLSSSVAALRKMDDTNLAQSINIEFVRNLVRCSCTEPVPAGTPIPGQPASAPSDLQSAPLSHHPQAEQESPIESQLKNIVQQGKQLIQALESLFHVFRYLTLSNYPFS